MNFDFSTIEKGSLRGGYAPFPEDVIRVTRKGLIVAPSLATKLQTPGKYETENGDSRTYIKIGIDQRNQAMALQGSATPDDAFSFHIEDNGRLWCTSPVGFRRAGLPTGDYKAVEGYTGPGVAAQLAN